MRWPSLAHSPKSISLHLSEQKGRNGKSSFQKTIFLQLGHSSLIGSLSVTGYSQKMMSIIPDNLDGIYQLGYVRLLFLHDYV